MKKRDLLLKLVHTNFSSKTLGVRKLSHSSEMPIDALMHGEGLNGYNRTSIQCHAM